jgi:hypothetical protein
VAIRFVVVWVLLLGALACARANEAQDRVGAFYGPLPGRDLTVFGYLRLDMRPTAFVDAAPGEWRVDSELAYQNTWALTPAVRRYLEARLGRRRLDQGDVDAIVALDGESYLVDLELGEFSVTLSRQLSDKLAGYAVLGGVTYGGGMFDGAIEQFHEALGMHNAGRTGLPRGEINVIYDLKSHRQYLVDQGPVSGLLDPTLGLRYVSADLPDRWRLALEGAVKVPVAGERRWLSTGHADLGLQATFAREGRRHAPFASVSLVHYAGSGQDAARHEEKLLPALVLGLESKLSARTNSIVQLYASPSVYGSNETDLAELRAPKYLLSVGARHRRGAHLYSFAFVENVANFNNTPDAGFQFGWTWLRP